MEIGGCALLLALPQRHAATVAKVCRSKVLKYLFCFIRRNVGIGVCSSFARVGAILSPVIAMLTDVAKPLPYVVFGVMSIVGGRNICP